jgi:tetratricopeptide (TPR) repeat protein
MIALNLPDDFGVDGIDINEPTTAADWYALGRIRMHAGSLDDAMNAFDKAVFLEPQAFWPNFYLGLCASRTKRFDGAVQAFCVCIALAPTKAPCYFNRGVAYAALGGTELERARRDYEQALRLDPDLVMAALNRGIVYLRMGQYSEAIADLDYALGKGGDQATVHYYLALAYRDLKQTDKALQHLHEALRSNPQHAEARKFAETLLQGGLN